MKKIFGIIIVITATFMIYNSKRDYYEKNADFFSKSITGEIKNIKRIRGTKVYYNDGDYFYLDVYSGDPLKVGDVFKKNDSILIIHRDGKIVGNGKITKPKESYFKFFFNL